MTSSLEKTLFSFVPPSNSLVSISDLQVLFVLTWRPSRALDSPIALLPELQRYMDTFRCAAPGAEVPGHCQKQLTQTLIVRLLKTQFTSLIRWNSQKKPESPKIIPTLFLAAAMLSAAKNIVVIIFGPTGFFGSLTSFADFQHISCQILSEKFSCQISCQIPSVSLDTRFLT